MSLLNEKEKEIIEISDFIVVKEKEKEKEKETGETGEKKENFLNDKFSRTLLIFSLTFAFISIFLAQFCVVSGESMLPTLKNGDVVLVEKVSKKYERMDIVVVKANGKRLIKRIIGLPGEEIKIENGKVFIDGKELEDVVEEKMEYSGIATEGIKLGNDEYFVLGDNRNNSADSRDRFIGNIKKRNIIGKEIVIFPFGK